MRKSIRMFIAATIAAVTFGAVASPAFAGDYQSHKSKAYERVTNDCLQYAGCRNIVLHGNSNGGGGCSIWYFTYQTNYSASVSRSVAVQDYPVLCAGGSAQLYITDYS